MNRLAPGFRCLPGLWAAVALSACGSDDAASTGNDAVSDTGQDTSQDVVPDLSDDSRADTGSDTTADSTGPGAVLAEATIGPAGGAIFDFDFEFIVRPGSLSEETRIEIRRAAVPEAMPFIGIPLELHPPGLTFDPPAVLRFVIPDDHLEEPVAAVLTLPGDLTRFQDVTAAVGGPVVMAHVPHFSIAGLVAANQVTTQVICCEPKDPAADPSVCVFNPTNGQSCDPDLCDQTPGVCAMVPPWSSAPCPCKSGVSGVPDSACLSCDPIQCVPDYDYCPPGNHCDTCQDPVYKDKDLFKISYNQLKDLFADKTCVELAAFSGWNSASFANAATSWCVVQGLGKWCAYQDLLKEKGCTNTATTIASVCGGGGCCKAIVPGFEPPGMPCSSLPELECTVYGGQGTNGVPQYCTWDANATSCEPTPPPDFCALCTDPAIVADPFWQAAFQGGIDQYADSQLTCAALHDILTGQLTPPIGAPGTVQFATTHGRLCAMNKALQQKGCTNTATTSAPFCSGGGCCKAITPGVEPPGMPCSSLPELECTVYGGQGTNGVPQYCTWDANATSCDPTPPPPPPSDCDGCTDPQITQQPEWQVAYNGGIMTYVNGGMDCATLAQQNVPAPSGPWGSVQYLTTHGRWCAMNQALHNAGCTAGTSGGVTTIAPFCPKVSCCKPIDPNNNQIPNIPNMTCEDVPQYDECVHSLAKGICTWDVSASCPGSASCAECKPRYSDPTFMQAVQSSRTDLDQADCTDLQTNPAPPMSFTSSSDPALAKWCAWADAVEDKCSWQLYQECQFP